MIGEKNLEEYNYFVDQGSPWQDHSRLEENITHIVRKGIFMQDGDVQVDDVVLSLCGMYHYSEETVLGEFDVDWFNSWNETGACEKCFGILVSREFQEWLVGEGKSSELIRNNLEKLKEMEEQKDD